MKRKRDCINKESERRSRRSMNWRWRGRSWSWSRRSCRSNKRKRDWRNGRRNKMNRGPQRWKSKELFRRRLDSRLIQNQLQPFWKLIRCHLQETEFTRRRRQLIFISRKVLKNHHKQNRWILWLRRLSLQLRIAEPRLCLQLRIVKAIWGPRAITLEYKRQHMGKLLSKHHLQQLTRQLLQQVPRVDLAWRKRQLTIISKGHLQKPEGSSRHKSRSRLLHGLQPFRRTTVNRQESVQEDKPRSETVQPEYQSSSQPRYRWLAQSLTDMARPLP